MKIGVKVLIFVVLLGAVLSASLGGASATTHHVNPGESIQAVINNATAGDTVIVHSGNYSENVWVNKSVTIKSSSEDPTSTIVQAEDPALEVFFVDASSVTISGFSIGGSYACGVFLYYGTSCTITNNVFMWNTGSVGLWGSTYNTISNNYIANNLSYNDYAGITFYSGSDHNTVDNNVFTYNRKGIEFYPQKNLPGSSYNNITNNEFTENQEGILIWGSIPIREGYAGPSDYNIISNNAITDNDGVNILLAYSSNNSIEDNDISSSDNECGLELRGFSSYNTIKNNAINNNGVDGILLWSWGWGWPDSPCYNIITDNTANFNKYSGIELADYSCENVISHNTASSNRVGGIGLFYDTCNNVIAENELSSNFYGLAFIGFSDMTGNQIYNNTIRDSKTYGLWVRTDPLAAANYIHSNELTNNNLFGIFVQLSTNNQICDNIVTYNVRGIGLEEASDNLIINNLVNYNEISGISLINATHNTLYKNTVEFNTYDGIYLANSDANENITENKVASSYFGILLYSSNDNSIVNNTAESIYYYKVFNYSSTGNTIVGFAPEDIYDQTEIVNGVRVSIPESLTPSLQVVEPWVNATYLVIAENLGNVPDTFAVHVASSDGPEVLALDRTSVTLGPGAISASVVGTEWDTITVNVTGAQPGIYRATIEAVSQHDSAVKDRVETWTIVRGVVGPEPVNTTSTNSAIVNSTLTDSTIHQSVIIASTLTNAIVANSAIKNSVVTNTELYGMLIENAIVTNGSILSGIITINDIAYIIQNETLMSDLVSGADYSNSNLVGITGLKLLTLDATNSSISFEISASGGYFAGSLITQRAVIPPFGIPGFSNNVGGYIYVEPSENLANSTGWVLLKVFYDQCELGNLNESSLTLMYYNGTGWEALPIAELSKTENFITINTSHYSVFALRGKSAIAPTPPFTKTDVGVTSNITLGNASELTAYLPSEYAGAVISDVVVLNVNVSEDTPGNPADDAYTDITINVGAMDIGTCKVFKSDTGFLPEVPDVNALPTVKPPGEPAFSRNIANNTVTVRLYVGDPLLAVLPLALPRVHNLNTGEHFASIQAAIDDADTLNWHTMLVDSGTYHERVNVTKQLALRGNDTGGGKPIVDAGGNGSAITLSSAGIVLDGFIVINAADAGIYLTSSYNTIVNNTASNNSEGIYLSSSSNSNNLTGNFASKNIHGIYLSSSSNNTLADNTVSKNVQGIYLDSASYNHLKGNTASNNSYLGINLRSSGSNNLTGNTASNNIDGIILDSSSNNNLTGNIVSDNLGGLVLHSSSTNLIYNNYFNNSENALDADTNIWNISKTAGKNIVGGPQFGGNYWSDYYGNDTDGDGIGDDMLPYKGRIINGGDWLPLVKTEEEPFTQVPVGVTSDISLADPSDIAAYLPPEYDGIEISNAVVLNVNVTDATPGNPADDAYTDITINVGAVNITTCKVFKSDMGFLPEVEDVKTLPALDGEPAFSRDLTNNTVTVRLYVGDPLLALLPPAEPPIFDTDEGSYPSISGTFTGTITPSRNLTVSTLYTYSCKGTGGHTKSINLYENDILRATGVCSGYQGDWHDITFTEVTLLKNHEYRYVIVTGSYPQIIHEPSLDVTGGKITCEEFVDINGKRHEDGWIPAIRLS